LEKTSIFRLFLFAAAKKAGNTDADRLGAARCRRKRIGVIISFRRQLSDSLNHVHASRRL
jgi:hypothetical protein